jgi:hypothetical protein
VGLPIFQGAAGIAVFRPGGATGCSTGERSGTRGRRVLFFSPRSGRRDFLGWPSTAEACVLPPPRRGGSHSTGCVGPPVAGGTSPVATLHRPAGAKTQSPGKFGRPQPSSIMADRRPGRAPIQKITPCYTGYTMLHISSSKTRCSPRPLRRKPLPTRDL